LFIGKRMKQMESPEQISIYKAMGCAQWCTRTVRAAPFLSGKSKWLIIQKTSGGAGFFDETGMAPPLPLDGAQFPERAPHRRAISAGPYRSLRHLVVQESRCPASAIRRWA
ncbi:MAG TPA: hypothetical protein VGO40_07200, partial [Longimicrobium sp.]|nr:hypothetical protein [Longimicrobium sp.]